MSSAAPDDVLTLLRQRGRAPDPAALEGLMRGVVAAIFSQLLPASSSRSSEPSPTLM